ncbi:immunoglobulin-like domain-containing receptor 2 [Gadus morhua]|uniref:immunoglobulin-like domain-containing receptor 2 n=1 Tax=Gadus morhua TaxID=8049 RepID=UPI0011B6DD0F|nr:immunoglobulin-like domain-containing receptor 2 [Gadus morhua]
MSLQVPWWVPLLWLAGVCSGVQVFVRDEKRFAVLFQAVVLPCHYTSVSTQTPVVQWVYKSYCRDRTRDTFGFSNSRAGAGGYDGGVSAAVVDYLDCADSSRTVRTVASIAGSSVTLSEHYKNRDISIINTADLRIGEVQWGDSGVYICKVVISDDLEGQSEANVELLVLGFSGDPEDLLPGFEMKIMPEWVFVGVVALGSVLVLLLLGVCWCQCCPHSCCCYVSCWCCPDTCCCPRHLYEAGKGIKVGTHTPTPTVMPYPPYFISGLPTMVPIAPPSLVDKTSPVPPSDSSLLASASSLSELSSLHEGEAGFRQTYRDIQKNALPAIPDRDPAFQSGDDHHHQRCRGNRSPEPQRYQRSPPASQRYRDDRDDPDDGGPLPPRRFSDDPPSSSHTGRSARKPPGGREPERWNPRSELLQRKAFRSIGPTGSLDELERDAYRRRGEGGRPGDGHRGNEDEGDAGDRMELREFRRQLSSPCRRDGPPQRYRDDRGRGEEEEEEEENGRPRPRRERMKSDGGEPASPLASPTRRRGNSWDSERHRVPPPPAPRLSPPPSSSSTRDRDYDGDSFLGSLLERKARLRGAGPGRGDQDSDSPSKLSSKLSSGESGRFRSRSPNGRRETDSAPPCSERERGGGERGGGERGGGERGGGERGVGERGWGERGGGERSSPRPASSQTSKSSALASSNRREDPRDKPRKTNTMLSRDSLIV